jgi:hypothetical protein
MLMVRMFVHTRPWLVIDCTPPTPNFPLPFPSPNGPLQFTLHVFEDGITNQVHSLIQSETLIRYQTGSSEGALLQVAEIHH